MRIGDNADMSTEGEARHTQMRVCGDVDMQSIYWRYARCLSSIAQRAADDRVR